MNNVTFVKSFSSGQITIPKSIRDYFGMPTNFWLKLYVQEGKIIAEPLEKETNKSLYLKKLSNIKGSWLNEKEMAKNRKQLEDKLIKRRL